MRIGAIYFCIAATIVAGPGSAAAAPQRFEDPAKICAQATAAQERAHGLPHRLLNAIALAESGRWDENRRASIAWPWTVTSGGDGRHFPTRQAALAEVRRLKAKGATNIDVGCMQINLFHHGHAFASPEHAMDPVANVSYAAQFLRQLYGATGDWMEAAGRYHSSTPERGQNYRAKIARLWDQAKREPVMVAEAPVASPPAPRPAQPQARPLTLNEIARASRVAAIDIERTAALNASFKSRRAGALAGATAHAPAPDPHAVRQGQLATWRDGAAGENTMAAQAEARRAIIELERRKALANPRGNAGGGGQQRFADRRAQQIERWRANQATADGDS